MLLDVTQEQRESGVVGVVNASILLVIRDKQERSVLQQALSDEGWQVTLAETAAKARWTANEQGFEFAVVDDRLPDDEPWYRVISDLQGSVVWIAALLNENKTGRANRAIRAGANFCWRHPVTPSRLQLLVT